MSESSVTLPVALILLLVVFVVAALIGTNIGQQIFQVISKYIPGGEGGAWTPSTMYDAIAMKSTDALVCAVKTVITGPTEKCSSSYKQPTQMQSVTPGKTGMIVADNYGWLGEGYTGYAVGTASGTVDESQIPSAERAWLYCDPAGTKCTVYNFRLPQYVGNAEQWIAGYGDPQYLVYWDTFPIEEETWSFKPDWKIHVAIAAISIVPIGKVFGMAARVGIKTAAFKVAGGVGLRLAATNYFKEELKKVLATQFVRKNIKSVLVKGVVLEAAVAVAQLVDSMSSKYESMPNAVLLKSPYEKPQPFSLPSEWKGNLVLNYWRPEAGMDMTNMYLASPCYLKEFEIRKDVAVCEGYMYDVGTGNYGCDNPRKDTSKIECGKFDKTIDDYVGWPVYDTLIATMKFGEKRIYEKGIPYPSSEWKYDTKKLFLPWTSANFGRSGVFYLSDFAFKQRSGHGAILKEFYDYDATVYNSADNKHVQTLSKPSDADTVVMEKGREYILDAYIIPGTFYDDVALDIYLAAEANPCDLEHFIEYENTKYITCNDINNAKNSRISDIYYITEPSAGLYSDVITDKHERVRIFTPSETITAGQLTTNFNKRGGGSYTMSLGNMRHSTSMKTEISCRIQSASLSGSLVMGPWRERTLYCETPFFKVTFGYNSSGEYMKALASSDGRSDIKEDYKGTFYLPSFKLDKGNSDPSDDYHVFFVDEDSDGRWDELTVSELSNARDYSTIANVILGENADLVAGAKAHNMVSFSSIGSNGNAQHITMTNCQKPAVIIDLGKVDEKKTADTPNYCLRNVPYTVLFKVWAGRAASVGAIIAVTYLSGGSALIAYGAVATAAAMEAYGEISYEYSNKWP